MEHMAVFDTNILIDLFNNRVEAADAIEHTAFLATRKILRVLTRSLRLTRCRPGKLAPPGTLTGDYSPSPGNRNGLIELRAKPSCSIFASRISEARSSATASTFGSFS